MTLSKKLILEFSMPGSAGLERVPASAAGIGGAESTFNPEHWRLEVELGNARETRAVLCELVDSINAAMEKWL